MKTCANCGLDIPDEEMSCPSCSTDSFVSTSPEALGHIISPEEQRFWERMTFRQFAVFTIRLQALWLLFYSVIDATYLTDYLIPSVYFSHQAKMIVVRSALQVGVAIVCLRHADRIVSWFVKDILPKRPKTSDNDKPSAETKTAKS